MHFRGPCDQIIHKFMSQILATGKPRDTQRLTWVEAPLHTVSVVLDFFRGTPDDSVMNDSRHECRHNDPSHLRYSPCDFEC
jgi:hypothetical protein